MRHKVQASRPLTMKSVRVDRWATVSIFGRLQQRKNGHPAERIPILMYHGVTESGNSHRHPYYETATSPAMFEQHVRFLRDEGYTSVSLSEALRRIKARDERCSNSVVITFDDGYQNFYTRAFPTLIEYGFTATVFLPTAYISQTRRSFNGFGCLTWDEVRELKSSGIEFGSHTEAHPQLRDLGAADIRHELRCSKETIENMLGCALDSFAYPYAFPETDRVFVGNLRDMLEETGYDNGVCTIVGTADATCDRYFMRRLPVNSGDDLRFFSAKLRGGYNWLHTVQYARKLCL